MENLKSSCLSPVLKNKRCLCFQQLHIHMLHADPSTVANTFPKCMLTKKPKP